MRELTFNFDNGPKQYNTTDLIVPVKNVYILSLFVFQVKTRMGPFDQIHDESRN
jgi:hypothetical protein